MKIVVKVGGSAIVQGLDAQRFKDYADVIKQLAEDHTILIVIGGGTPARDYINVSKQLGANNSILDYIGIGVSRLNARLLISALGDIAYPEPPYDYKDAGLAMYSGKVVVMGGVVPGQTTDAVAAILAEYVHADLLIRTTSVDGVFTADPKLDPKATKIDSMTPQELVDMVTKIEMTAGANNIFDPLGAQIVKRSRIPTVVVNGKQPENLIKAVKGEPIGTIIKE
ncbi:UMP kinase [Methanocella arvoryzae]|uniref:Uridylate kinase n=1 Tax=Methanocella arvoryzae (strain DSM 22066 / NBRC 105507 / MRE50) TaxID=351160 RepID=PYRH_METAR|nr:RecName: Full=Uridylate kinase; Short=UK; AltName: Full=Uridine monophosphate kinase; Short=UMP kinase; Short=UMPK [Methanocella arvoryzae MRE50]CAJ37037.1 putative uridylate kinase [Methanocella arvoryzae MRE50]